MSRPLDKAEAASWGRFVHAAYAMFKRDRAALTPEPQPHDLPDSYELVAWLNMTDFGILGNQTTFYGFIARSRQNRHEFVLAIRGTEGVLEWWDDVFTRLVPFTQVPQAGRVEQGFDKIYSSLKVVKRWGATGSADKAVAAATPDVPRSFAEQLEELADSLEEADVQEKIRLTPSARPRRSFTVTAHSLGSALATLFVIENKWKNKFDVSILCSFASPRVGNAEFVNQFNRLPITSWRLVNTQDLVPQVPLRIPWLFDYQQVDTAYEFSSKGVVKWSPGCWHSMKTYLHWLDPNAGLDPECKP
jgi:triacylglycerol lipase